MQSVVNIEFIADLIENQQALITHVFKQRNIIYFVFTGFAFIVALIASIMELTDLGECPKTVGGTPMCYYSFLIFSSLIMLKLMLIKRKNEV